MNKQLSIRIAALMLAVGACLGHVQQTHASAVYYAYVRYIPFNSTTPQTMIQGPYAHPINAWSHCSLALSNMVMSVTGASGTVLYASCVTESRDDDDGSSRTD